MKEEEDFEIEDSDFDFTEEELDFFIEVMNFDEDKEELDEAPLSVAQRRKMGRRMKRQRHKLSRRRKISARRRATPQKIKMRARRAARNVLRKRVAGKAGAKYSTLSPSKKISIDRRLEKKKKHVDTLARRMMPKVRKKERERLKKARSSKREGYEQDMKRRKNINESFDRFASKLDRQEKKVNRSLREKARENDMPVSVIREVYERGIRDFQENGKRTLTESQWAFSRVNSFIEGGKARQIDEDLWEKVGPLRNLMEKMNLKEESVTKIANKLKKKLKTKGFGGSRQLQTGHIENSSYDKIEKELKSLGFEKVDEVKGRRPDVGVTKVYKRPEGMKINVTERKVGIGDNERVVHTIQVRENKGGGPIPLRPDQ